MMIKDLGSLAPMVPWLEYINNILTTDLLQVRENVFYSSSISFLKSS